METDLRVEVGAMFPNKKQLKAACQTLATRENFEYTVAKSDKSRMIIKCVGEGCSWRLYASNIGSAKEGYFEIKTITGEHKCFGVQHLGHRQASARFIADQIQKKLRDQPKYCAKDIQNDIRREYGISIRYLQANRAKEAALEAINGTDEDSYNALPKYCDDLSRNNPDRTIVLECTSEAGNRRFQRMFVCYAASAVGFGYCLPVLGLDGTHLKTKYRGILLAATGTDANGSLFPLASAVVDAENDNNWFWFIQLLHGVIEQHAPQFLVPQTLTFVSDRQKGLLEGVANVFPDSPHGYCLRHLYENMWKNFKHPKLKTFLWQAARAITEKEFNEALAEIKRISPAALEWLLAHAHPRYWAELYFPGRRYGHTTSNIAESLNAAILEAREKPILAMFEHMRHHTMGWFTERRQIDSNVPATQIVVSSAVKKIQELTAWQARRYRIVSASDQEFEIFSLESSDTYIVKLEYMTCTCFQWQSTGIPCSHAIAAILMRKENPQTYVQAFLSLDAYRNTYAKAIHSPNADQADRTTNTPIVYIQMEDNGGHNKEDRIVPPHARRQPGRPKVRRNKSGVEGPFVAKRAKKCSRCGRSGHAVTTCDATI